MSLTGKPSITSNGPVSNDGFWPDLIMGDLVGKYRIPSEYDNDVILTGLQLSIIRVNAQLVAVADAVVLLGHATFDDYMTDVSLPIGESEMMLINYQHAVFSRAKAFLLQQFNSMNRRPQAENAAKESEMTEQFWMDESQAAIRAMSQAFLSLEPVSAKAGFYVASL
jgi:hypothetical protein